ncbi:MAG TPA: hypothetical protein VGL81_14800 [Polyangiaceae bacterium]
MGNHLEVTRDHVDLMPAHVEVMRGHLDLMPGHVEVTRDHVDLMPGHVEVMRGHIHRMGHTHLMTEKLPIPPKKRLSVHVSAMSWPR